MEINFKKYILFWISGSVSQLGSAMTSFALILWIYTQTGTAMTISLLAFFSYLPYIVVSLVAGGFADRHNKKIIMLVSDSVAAICSFVILIFWKHDALEIWHIYVANCIIGFMNAFQSPALSVAIGINGTERKDNTSKRYGLFFEQFNIGHVTGSCIFFICFWRLKCGDNDRSIILCVCICCTAYIYHYTGRFRKGEKK